MDKEGFIKSVKDINIANYGFGNEVLYLMALDPTTLKNEKILAGAMWLIGRSYAASPQRRNYSKKWKVKSSNDGREDFFNAIAKTTKQKEIIKTLKNVKENYSFEYKNIIKNEKVDTNAKDFLTLIKGIKLVLGLNKELSEALQEFDGVPENKRKKIRCSNHISFCSKFLHFYLPNVVFIIDNYASEGARLLSNKNKHNVGFDEDNKNPFDDSVFTILNKRDIELLVNAIKEEIRKDIELHDFYQYDNKTDNSKANDYIKHCARSYILGSYFKINEIEPINQIQFTKKGVTINPMSRLTDAIFLNVKKL